MPTQGLRAAVVPKVAPLNPRATVAGAILAGLLALTATAQPARAADRAGLPVLTDKNGKTHVFRGANIPGKPFNNRYGGQTLQIDQFAERATLHWESFNIDENNEVVFKQPSSSSIALNRVMGDTDAGSIIAGRLTANGRVFLINQNGILFTKTAKVNTQSLVASTLDIDDDVFEDIGFLNAINEPTPRAAFEIGETVESMGDIEIEAGASITSGQNGRIMMFAPKVTNAGDINAPEGEIILAGTQDKVFLAADTGDSRGLLVEVSTGGDVSNVGKLVAERGSVSLLGLAVRQSGVARATTSVSLNGSVKLLAQDMNGTDSVDGDTVRTPQATRTGELILAENSITEVLPDSAQATALDASSQPLSSVTMQGKRIVLEGGSRVTAPGGTVTITATTVPQGVNAAPPPGEVAELQVMDGSLVDVSGTEDTVVSVTRNVVEVEARGNELADSPQQRNGPVAGKTLKVDVREGTDFLNIDGALGAIQRDVNERLSSGGTIRLNAENAGLSVEEGAVLDVSGGRVTYTDGLVATSKLVTADGAVVDIADADPNLRYGGVLGVLEIVDPKWGISERFESTLGRIEPGYIEGKDAGQLILNLGRQADFSGTLLAHSSAGRLQRSAPSELNGASFTRLFSQVPLGGRLQINQNSLLTDLIVGSDEGAAPALNGHPESTANALVISPELLSGSGVSRVDLRNPGRIILNRDIELPVFGDMALTGTQVLVQSDIRTPGGDITLKADGQGIAQLPIGTGLVQVDGALDVSGAWRNDSAVVNPALPEGPIVTEGGKITISSDLDLVLTDASRLDVSGGAYLDADGRFTGGEGGEVNLSTWVAREESNTARLDIGGELRGFGLDKGGRLDLTVEALRISDRGGADATETAFNGAQQVSGAPSEQGVWNTVDLAADSFGLGGFQDIDITTVRGELDVAPGARIELLALNPLLEGPRAQQALQQSGGLRLNPFAATNGHPAQRVPSGTALSAFTRTQVLPAFDRSPVNLALTSNGDSALSLGSGAAIVADPGATVELTAASGMMIDGLISAPSGTIELTNTGGRAANNAVSRIWLGPLAHLSAPGSVRIDPVSEFGLRVGEVLDAGRVSVLAQQGSIIGAPTAIIDVNAVAADLDTGRNGRFIRQRVDGDAGEIEFVVADALLYAGELRGSSAAGRRGGHLSVTLDPTSLDLGRVGPGTTSLISRGPHIAVMEGYNGELPGVEGELDPSVRNHAFVPLEQLVAGEFSALDVHVRGSAETGGKTTINGVEFDVPVPDTPDALPIIQFNRDQALELSRRLVLDATVIRSVNDAKVELKAPYVALGSADTRLRLDGSVPDVNSDIEAVNNTDPLRLTPVAGNGSLRVEGDLIELVGELVTEGVGTAGSGIAGVELLAARDLRMRGVRTANLNDFSGLFRTAGDLYIEAQRIYPTTLTDYEVAVEGSGGTLRIASPGASSFTAPLSVGGSLALEADTIIQGSTLIAPLGGLQLNAANDLQLLDGSLTSTSAFGVSAPFFMTQPGGDLVLPDPAVTDIVFVDAIENPRFERLLPQQRLVLQGDNIDVQSGARFDLRGGGDVRATEFQPGPGGSRDILLADLGSGGGVSANDAFAIVPGIDAFSPYDPLETQAFEGVQGYALGDTLVLEEGIPGLPAGEYAVLPARYALFGGYLVTPVAGTRDITAGLGSGRSDGAPILAGRFGVAGSGASDSRSQGFAIEDAATVRNRADYLETQLGDFYQVAGTRPTDAGTLSVEAQTTLNLAGRLIPDEAAGGRGSNVDILGDNITIDTISRDSDGIVLLTEQLQQLGADSLLIGGRRSVSADGLVITSVSSDVTVADGVALDVPELILVADTVNLESSAETPTRVQSDQSAVQEAETLLVAGDSAQGVNGDAAVVAVSDRKLTLERLAPSGSQTGRVNVDPNVVLGAQGSLIVDAEGDVSFVGSLEAGDSALVNLGASSVSLGDIATEAAVGGLVLTNARLAGLAGTNLRLRSGSTISVLGSLSNPDTGQPVAFGDLVLDARGWQGVDNINAVVSVVADRIRLTNSSGVELAGAGTTSNGSALNLSANQLILGDGPFSVQGYDSVAVQATNSVLLDGQSELRVESPLALDTPLITATTGTDSVITAQGGELNVTGGDSRAELPANPGLAASLLLEGEAVTYAGRTVLPSGIIEIRQLGDDTENPVAGHDLTIADDGILDVSGATLDFGPTQVGTPGGIIRLFAETGDLNLAANNRFDVSPSPLEGEAGELQLTAPLGVVRLTTDTDLVSGGRGGDFSLDARKLEVGGVNDAAAYSALNQVFSEGFSASRSVRLRDQSILLDSDTTVRAHRVRAVSDTQDVVIRGTIDASGLAPGSIRENGGSILLAAGDSVDIASTAVLRATGSRDSADDPGVGTKGGRIDFIALDADGDDAAGLTDKVNLHAGAVIDVAGGPGPVAGPDERVVTAERRLGGQVLVHTRRLDADRDGQTETLVVGDMAATLLGADQAELVATRVARDGDAIGRDVNGDKVLLDLDRDLGGDTPAASITSADLEAIRAEINTFLEMAPASVSAFQVVPGIHLRSSAGLRLESEWDFLEQGPDDAYLWHFGKSETAPGVAGVLTLSAADNVVLQGNLTDNFFDFNKESKGPRGSQITVLPTRVEKAVAGVDDAGNPVLVPPSSWRYIITAGADTSSADPAAVVAGSGDIALEEDVVVRTGTGDINLAAGANIKLASGSAIYTGGYDRGISRNFQEARPPTASQFPLDAESLLNQWLGNGALFPVSGGNVQVSALGDIMAAASQELPSDWLTRIGEADKGGLNQTLASDFGAVPTHWGIAYHRFDNGIGALGGGALDVRAGGDVTNLTLAIPSTGRTVAGAVQDPNDGLFGVALETTEVAGGGQLTVDVGGSLRGGSLVLGDGAGDVRVSVDITDDSAGVAPAIYVGGDSRILLTAGGSLAVRDIQDPTSVDLSQSQASALSSAIINPISIYLDNEFFTYAENTTVDIRALSGDVRFLEGAGFADLVPPVLRAVSASNDIRLETTTLIQQYPSFSGQLELLAWNNLTGSDGNSAGIRQSDRNPALLPSIDVPTRLDTVLEHAEMPVHRDDGRPNLFVARDGTISASGGGVFGLQLAKQTVFSAGQDLRDLRVQVQHARSEGVSLFSAGHDIVQSTQRDPFGDLQVPSGESDATVPKYDITGPGTAQFIAGHSISLGTSQGIETRGNVDNRELPDEGAGLQLWAGLGEEPAYGEFIQSYLVDAQTYRSSLTDFLDSRGVALLGDDPIATFEALPRREQRLLIADILFNELKESGVDAQSSGSDDFSRGFDAISTLFPGGGGGDGDISMLLSQTQTLRGGDIKMLVPGGFINAGAADADIIQKGADELGIVTAAGGDIDVFVDGDFLVNSTRAFALQGDLLVWSSNGSIDAGRGAKTVTSIPDPDISVDPLTGQTVIEFPPAVEGSGLQGENVFLFAPRGAVNAGDAGIRAIGNLTVAATEVLGADNIDVGGVSAGVPVAGAGVSAGIANAGNVASTASKMAEDSTGNVADEDDANANTPLGILSVKIMGFGECPASNPNCTN